MGGLSGTRKLVYKQIFADNRLIISPPVLIFSSKLSHLCDFVSTGLLLLLELRKKKQQDLKSNRLELPFKSKAVPV